MQQHDNQKPIIGWSWGFSNLLKPLPKFAARLGAAMSAMSAVGIGYTFLIDSDAQWAKAMAALGILGAGISVFFAKK